MAIDFKNIFNNIPKITVKNGNPETWNKVADWVSRPAPNRLIMGGTAIFTQTAIDGHNKRVDEETRKVSQLRTAAKVIVGTAAGIAVRQPCYDFVNACTSPEGKKAWSQMLIPMSKRFGLKEGSQRLKNWRIIASTLLALGIMVFTNFLIDAPGTIKLTNKFMENSESLKAIRAKKAEEKGGLDVKV